MTSTPFTVPETTLPELVLEQAHRRGDRPALIDASGGRVVTFAELAAAVERLAAGLAARGVAPGDVVAVHAPNSPEVAVAFHGILRRGAVVTPANPRLTVGELASQLEAAGARILMTAPELLDVARQAGDRAGIRLVVLEGAARSGAGGSEPSPPVEGGGGVTAADDATPGTVAPLGELIEAGRLALTRHPGAADADRPGEHEMAPGPATDPPAAAAAARSLAVLPFSSGTTGLPKGVMLTHRNLVANVLQCQARDPVQEGEVAVAVLPFSHIYGMTVVMCWMLAAGATVVTLPSFDLEQFLATLERHRVTRAHLVPPIVLALARHPAVERFDLSALRAIVSGAAPLGAETAAACARRVGCGVYQGYGLTEASPVTHMTPCRPDADRPGSVGPPLPGTEARIVDLESGEELGPGREGEVLVRGPQVMDGYLGDPEATAAVLTPDGWLRTGDVGRVDDDGYLTLVDRVKDLIKYKGYSIAPAELEAVIVTHPAVSDAAVIPMPDAAAGEIPKAVVALVPDARLDADDLVAHVAARVAPFKRIRAVEIVDAIPRSPAGKILRRVLRGREAPERGAGGGPPGREPARDDPRPRPGGSPAAGDREQGPA